MNNREGAVTGTVRTDLAITPGKFTRGITGRLDRERGVGATAAAVRDTGECRPDSSQSGVTGDLQTPAGDHDLIGLAHCRDQASPSGRYGQPLVESTSWIGSIMRRSEMSS